jgi:hypothetical protein
MPIITCARRCIKRVRIVFALVFILAVTEAVRAEWSVDFSRRVRASREGELKASGKQPGQAGSALEAQAPTKGIIETIFDSGEPIQDLVILNTEHGFVPATVRIRRGGRYRVSVVNVNEKEKNVSFILDGFSEHHSTYYGRIKVFSLEPKKEGTYSFQSPETAAEGKLIVFNSDLTVRSPASEGAR